MKKNALPLAVLSTWLLACAAPMALWARVISFDVAVALLALAALGAFMLATLCLRERVRHARWDGTLVWSLPLALAFAVLGIYVARFPWLHDVATSMGAPPTFTKLEPVDAPGAPVYPEHTQQVLQSKYPKLKGQSYSLKTETLIGHAVLAARELPEWSVANYDWRHGRLEGTTRSRLTGIVSHVSIATRPQGKRVVLDIRSRSAVRGSDFGEGLRVIRRFNDELGKTWTCAPGKLP